MDTLYCLRCKTIALQQIERHPGIRFFSCSECGRHYALEPGKQLTFRWLHPVTLALYAVLFDANPVERASSVAQEFVNQRSMEKLTRMVQEIRLELEEPTQQVRDSLDCVASEADLRTYLAAFCDEIDRLQGSAR